MVADVPPVPAPQTIQAGSGSGSRAIWCEDRFGDVVVAAPVGGAFGQAELIEMASAARGVPSRARVHLGRIVDEVAGAAERLARAAILRGAVQAGITATKGRPSRRANQASEIAVLPEEASTTVWPCAQATVAQRVQEQRAREPVLETAGRVRGLVLEVEARCPGKPGRSSCSRWVSAERAASRSSVASAAWRPVALRVAAAGREGGRGRGRECHGLRTSARTRAARKSK